MVADANRTNSELEFAERYGVMRFDPDSIGFDSKLSTNAETSLYVANEKWMFGELIVSYPLPFFDNIQAIADSIKEFYFFIEDDRPREGVTTDMRVKEYADRWEIEITFVNVGAMLV